MEVVFKNEHLQELYVSGKSAKYKKVPPHIIRKFPMAVRILQQIKIIQDIWRYLGYNFEKLEGQISIPCEWIEHGG